MTNNIQKLYEIAGVKKFKSSVSCLNCSKKTIKKLNEWDEEYIGCEWDEIFIYCPHAQELYPPFTAEKQLELVKWLAKKETKCEIGYSPTYHYTIDSYTDTCYYFDDFSNAIANTINIIWQDLTDDQKQEIKEILQ